MINLYSINTQSLTSDKLSHIMNLITSHQHKNILKNNYPTQTIIACQETWWDQTKINTKPFQTFATNRKNKKGGGVAILTSPDLNASARADLAVNDYIETVAIELPQKKLILANYYNTKYHNTLKAYIHGRYNRKK